MNNWSDLYSGTPALGATVTSVATAAAAPNQSIVTGAGNVQNGAAASSQSAGAWLVGMALALVALRVFIAWGGKVA